MAKGERSSHNHVLVADRPETTIRFFQDATGRYYVESDGTMTLGHWIGTTREKADHDAITLAPGIYDLPVQREYDELGARQVLD